MKRILAQPNDLRENPEFKDVTLCALTGHTPSEADRVRVPQAGFDNDLVKPRKGESDEAESD